MMVNIIMFCLMGAVFSNPISFNAVLESNELDSNSTENLSSQSSENGTSALLSSEESTSKQSQSSESSSESESESTSTESTSEDRKQTEEESNSLLDEKDVADPMAETTDNSMGSEENIRKSEGAAVSTNDSSESTSSESNETSETSETSDSSDSSDSSTSVEESEASDDALLGQLETKDCVNGTQSCESEEYLFQDIGDDAHYSVDSLMVPDEDEREFSLRR
uniref:Secretory calcium-binding phosphoprotein 1 n=1 Tax=Gasterosteus aculeatus TaxID=69293 RepID=G3Q190_GASAC